MLCDLIDDKVTRFDPHRKCFYFQNMATFTKHMIYISINHDRHNF